MWPFSSLRGLQGAFIALLVFLGVVVAYGEWRASVARSAAERARLEEHIDTGERIDAVDVDADDDGVIDWLRNRIR